MFSDRLKELRKGKNITQEELARLLGVERSTVGKWESKKGIVPPADMLVIISDFFNVSLDYLLGKTAFKNGFELFEHWGYSPNGFESAFDFGELLKNEREKQGVSQEEASEALGITVSDVDNIEEGLLPLNYDWAEKYAAFLGTSVSQIFFDNDMYEEEVPEQFHDNIKAYEELKTEADEEALKENLYEVLKENKNNQITTIAAHHDGDELTEEEIKAIEEYIQFVKSRRNQK